MGGVGDLALSALWRIDSGTTYSLAASNQRHHAIPERKAGCRRVSGCAGEPDACTSTARGTGPVQGLPGGRPGEPPTTSRCSARLKPYLNVTIFNAFNNQTLIRWNTTVSPGSEHARSTMLGLRDRIQAGCDSTARRTTTTSSRCRRLAERAAGRGGSLPASGSRLGQASRGWLRAGTATQGRVGNPTRPFFVPPERLSR